MSQFYKSKYEQLRENSESTQAAFENDVQQSPPRNICFILEDDSQFFLNYGYLVSGSLDSDKEKIVLTFTSHDVTIEGKKLEGLFYELVQQKVRLIKIIEERYLSLPESTHNIVTNIFLKKLN